MKMLDSIDKLKTWDEYREFLKENLKLMDGEEPCYVSKDKLEFDVRGKPWFGHAFLAGKNAKLAVKNLKKDGVTFKEGLCSADGKDLTIAELQPATLTKEAAKTVQRLQLGYKVVQPVEEQGAEPDAPEAESAVAPEQQARGKKLDDLKQLSHNVDRLLAALSKAVASGDSAVQGDEAESEE